MCERLRRCTEPIARTFLVVLLCALLGAVFAVVLQGLGDLESGLISGVIGLSEQRDILALLGVGLGGVVLILQATIANTRARAMENSARAQAQAAVAQANANKNTEAGLREERLKNAIEHLGSASDSVRLGGAYELFHLAQDTARLRKTVLNVLCSHIRRSTKEGSYRNE